MKVENHCLDDGRAARTGIPEVVFAPSKSSEALIASISGLAAHHHVLVTKCTPAQAALVKERFGSAVSRLDEAAGVVVVRGPSPPLKQLDALVAVVSAGSADYAVAEEAALSAEYLGLKVMRLYDRGVAGVHRVLRAAEECERSGAQAVIAVAGMEGTMPSILAGLVRIPIIAVPTSVGYGTGLHGLTALATMLSSCAPGVVVVNIDNGFGAAAAARKILAPSRNSQ
ncbi:MAG: nickel pincer cofactor biosynthesis protein LarB [Candidatus Thermoplasmatota archaeon]